MYLLIRRRFALELEPDDPPSPMDQHCQSSFCPGSSEQVSTRSRNRSTSAYRSLLVFAVGSNSGLSMLEPLGAWMNRD